MSGGAPFNEQWIGRFENTALYNNPSNGTAFYYDGHVNIGFGYNLTSNISVARNALAAAGLTFTNPQWANVVTYAGMNTAAGTATLNSLVPERITQTQAYTVVGNYLNHTVIPGLTGHIPAFDTLPAFTQAALENVYYDHSTLLGPTTYGYANDSDLVGVAEELAFNADNTASDQTGSPGLERRFLADGFLALNVGTTIDGSNLISAVDTTNSDTTDVSHFLEEILTGTLEVSGTLTPLQYVQRWGTTAVQDYRNATLLLDKNLAQKHSVYVAEDNGTVPGINIYNISFTGPKFTLFTAGSYKGTITGFTPGRTLDLAGIGTATAATLGTGNKLTITGGTSDPITLQLATGQNYTGDKFKVASDGDGGTNVTIVAPSNVGKQIAGGGSYTNPPGQNIVGLQYGVYTPSGGATFTNQGSVQAVNGTGVEIIGNGTVTNSGGITGLAGVIISAVGKLLNSGTITGQNGNAVQFNHGGSVTNEASGVIDGTSGGVIITSATGTILNSGSISASASTGVGTELGVGGTLDNQTSTAVIRGGEFGLWAPGGPANVINLGTLVGTNNAGVEIAGTADVSNQGVITGANGVVVGGAGVLVNAASVTATNGNAVQINHGGSVTNDAGKAITGTAGGVIITSITGTILNSGRIIASASSGVGSELGAGGTLDNQTSTSVIRGGEFGLWAPGGPANVINLGTLVGTNNAGVEIAGTADVSNQGVITGANGVVVGGAGVLVNAASVTATNGNAVQINHGGSVTNDAGKAITGTAGGVIITSVVGTILNSGRIIASASSGVGSELGAGGTLDNKTSASVIRGGEFGLWAPGGPANVSNLGTLAGTNNAGVEIAGTADVSNQGVITGANGVVVGGAGVLVNAASVTATNGNAVQINHGGSVTNDAGKRLTGTAGGVIITSATGTIQNRGSIIASASSGVGTELGAGGTLDNQTSASVISGGEFGLWAPGGPADVTNLGTLVGTNNAGVEISGTADVSNQGVITGANGVVVGGHGVLVNAASITATNGNAVQVNNGGSVTNNAGKGITGTSGGVIITSAAGTIHNSGSITASASSGVGAELGAGGTLTDAAGATITGGEFGIWGPSGAAQVTVDGTVKGGTGVELSGSGSTLTVSGTIIGTGGVAVDLATGNRLIAEAGATFVGQVIDPGAADTLELASGQGTIGSNVQGFGAIAVDAGGDWTLGGLISVAQAANAGTVTLASGASLDIGAASGGGLYQLEAGATLDLHNLADGGPRVSFLGGGDLTLSAAASAAPLAVSGFGAGDTIDVRDLAPAGLMLASNGSGGVQLADQAGVLADVSFASGSAGALLPTSDHHGGVLVTVG